jgi:hypothetical protein
MLNRIIRLQAVMESIANQNASALEILARQQTQMRTVMYQNCLAFDYLLAEEGEYVASSTDQAVAST